MTKFLGVVFGVSALSFILVLVEPLGADNAVLHSMALDFVERSKVPYIGSWDNNFPGIMLLHVLGIMMFGPSGLAFRIFDALIQLAFVGFFYRFLSRWLSTRTAAIAAILYSFYYVAGNTYLFGQQDGYGIMFVLAGTAFVIYGEDRTEFSWISIIFGALVTGLSILMRPTFLLYPAIVSMYLLLDVNGKIQLRRFLRGALFFALSLLPIGILLLCYGMIPNGLTDFYNSTIRFNLDVYTKLAGGSFWIEIARTGLLVPFAVYAIVQIYRSRIQTPISIRHKRLYFALLFAGLFTVVLMGKFWRYQFAPFFIILIPLSAIGIEYITRRFASPLRKYYATVIALLLCSFVQYNPMAPLAFSLGLLTHHDPFESAAFARRIDSLTGAKPERAALEYLNRPENRNATIEICGFDPYLRLDLNRPVAGPYVTFHALAFRTDATNSGFPHYTEYQRTWQKSYVELLKQAKPKFIVLGRHQSFWYIHDVYDDCLRYLPGFDSTIMVNYRLDTTFGGFQIFRIN